MANHRDCDSQGRCWDGWSGGDGFDPTALFDFGFGLSYTTFKYESLGLSQINPRLAIGEELHGLDQAQVLFTAAVKVQNTGSVAGREVVQLYVQDPTGQTVVGYWRRLLGFGSVYLEAGASATVSIEVLWSDFALFDINAKQSLFSGSYTIYAGGVSSDTPLSATFNV